jgi:hypothetical protein
MFSQTSAGSGGGAGGLLTGSLTCAKSTALTVTVGAGGADGALNPGNNSVFSTITATGGGSGNETHVNGNGYINGGSGGGGGGTGTSGQGNNGGSIYNQGNSNVAFTAGGGGGGAGAVGGNGYSTSGPIGGNGGAGTASSITGTSVTSRRRSAVVRLATQVALAVLVVVVKDIASRQLWLVRKVLPILAAVVVVTMVLAFTAEVVAQEWSFFLPNILWFSRIYNRLANTNYIWR